MFKLRGRILRPFFYNSFYSHKIMRAVIQKVIHAKVDVLSEDSRETCGEINNGFMILLGVTHTDTEADAKYIADKTANLRIFEDENGKLNFIAQKMSAARYYWFPNLPLRRCAQRPPPIFLQCRARRTSG